LRIFRSVFACQIPLFFVGMSFRFNSFAIARSDFPVEAY
jgi:hypothetical protein